MKKFIVSIIAAAVLSMGANATEWEIDAAHSTIGFSVKHMTISTVRGNFGKYTAKIVYDDAKPSNSVFEASMDVNSINTGIEQRDKHLKSPDFFDAEKFPTVTFKATKVEALGGGKLKVTGDFTMHGVTKSIVLEGEGFGTTLKNPWGKISTGAHAETKINRKDYGLTWNKSLDNGGFVVSEEVKIEIDLELTQK